jgi:hypothetical protein
MQLITPNYDKSPEESRYKIIFITFVAVNNRILGNYKCVKI